MSQIEQLLKYQKEDEKLIKLEQEAASSEERKKYVQAKNFMTKAPEKLDQIDAKAAELEGNATARSNALRQAAMEFIDDALRRAEESVNTALAEIHTSRARFRGTAGVNEDLRAAHKAPAQENAQE